MASIAKDPGGKRRILFVDPLDKSKRQTIRLGKMAQRTAEGVKIKVEHLVAARASGHPIDSAYRFETLPRRTVLILRSRFSN